MKKNIICLVGLLLSACVSNHYVNNHKMLSMHKDVNIEDLVTTNVQIDKLKLENMHDVEFMKNWAKKSTPIRAEFWCMQDDHVCHVAKNFFKDRNITFHENALVSYNDKAKVELVYETIAAEECKENKMTGNKDFGCITSSNMIKMLPDRSQIVVPSKLDNYYIK